MRIESQIVDIDGSCRDVNFPDSAMGKAIDLINYIESFSTLRSASNAEGGELTTKEIKSLISSSATQTISSGWECHGLISQIQIFLNWVEIDEIFIELTFFPNDVNEKAYSLEAFKAWLKPFLVALNTDTYFVRYENVSWKYGDTSKDSGVIFTNKECELNG